ncbi:MAG: hypothetical protein NVSMB18_32090 [Acetobacteraceae bacterium]
MSVNLVGNAIVLSGPARVEDAEPLIALLLEVPGRAVDLTACGPLHAAVLQALLAFRPAVVGPAGDPFVRTWLVPLLAPAR